MTEKKPTRPRTFKSALAAWPEAMKAVQDNPGDASLGSLCTLLDVMDGEIVRTWDSDGHEWRIGVFKECRAAARQANQFVTSWQVQRAKERGSAAYAARRAKKEAEAA